jgi:hypothetical protein
MSKKILCLIVLAALVSPLLAEDPVLPAMDKKVGAALLDSIARLFADMAAHGTGTKEDRLKRIEDFLVQSMNEAKKAKDLNQIDPVFFARYRRLLGIIKMTMAPDPAGILVPVLDQEIKRFVYEVLGEDYKGTGPGAIGQVANAIADEMVNLQLHMDNVETKAKLRKAFDEKFALDSPKKPPEDRTSF